MQLHNLSLEVEEERSEGVQEGIVDVLGFVVCDDNDALLRVIEYVLENGLGIYYFHDKNLKFLYPVVEDVEQYSKSNNQGKVIDHLRFEAVEVFIVVLDDENEKHSKYFDVEKVCSSIQILKVLAY